ncbi:LD-carboxypeptidase [Rickettsiella endosymbiont of Aleochara curtula]|uniref:LD-carboxypeptidase n=1 Tax=Rickettsiella endosymbiont of Aleochara curtula TaxID=3077936 RepID=UPI00313E7EEF
MLKKIIFLVTALSLTVANPILAKSYRRVALISSSTQYNEDNIEQIKQELEKKSYIVNTQYLNQVVSDFGYVNTDQSRANALLAALSDKHIDIIWMVRGGAGAINLFPALYANTDKLKKLKPKIIVGFSDVTAIHYFVNTVLNWPSVHAVVAAYNKEMTKPDTEKININDRESIPSIKNLFTQGIVYQNLIPLNQFALPPIQGTLLGGNFTLIQAFFATRYEHDFTKDILILEDTGVSFRQLDRSLHQLLYKTDFKPRAIVFGQFYPLDPTDEQRLMYKTVIKDFAKKTTIPVYYFPYFGHGRENKPFIFGRSAAINCPSKQEYCTLKQTKITSF